MSASSTPGSQSFSLSDTDEFSAGVSRPRMHGHVVFVTGGTRGIGAAISRSFAQQGAIVAARLQPGHGTRADAAQAASRSRRRCEPASGQRWLGR